VADAFRFTKVADDCRTVPHSALLTLRLIGVDLTEVQLPDGKLTTNTDQRLAFHDAVVDVAGLHNSQVRLLGLRKGSIIAEFEFQGEEAYVSAAVKRVYAALLKHGPGSLEDRLCQAATVGMGPKSCRVWMIRTTSVGGWFTSEAKEEEVKILPAWAWIPIGLGCVLAVLCMLLMTVLCIKRRRRAKALNDAQSSNCKQDIRATSKDAQDNISDSASTATPDRVNSCVQTEMSGEIFDVDTMSNPELKSEDVNPELKSDDDMADYKFAVF